ncbi:ATP-dependent zinc metalloprotease FtsH [Patescibacteria group bacterium]|nr:ATP-dependent zinc metalloprotease FtsH [Patescibacteria group bacterium]MBU4511743.1 ATP-dependent zinc metalloprotease FtsH [Patescibacteria group bacterium]MCG2692818.1 ATP-dependent zinc metalloprotease FtsH [Candidatus Parcubacteria bacterium]
MKNLFKNFIILFIIFIVIAGIFSMYNNPTKDATEVTIDTILKKIEAEEIDRVEVEGEKVKAFANDGVVLVSYKEPMQSLTELFDNYNLTPEKIQKLKISIKTSTGLSFWVSSVLPFLLPLLIIGLFIFLMARQIQGANNRAMMFGQANSKEINPKDKKKKTTFLDVAGAREAKEELLEVVEFLRNPKKFTVLGAKVPKGVLLIGPTGTGKTLLARAIAGEANAPFYHISGSEFVEMFVGVGASRVRSLFQKAKKAAPAILFIDEIDAVGRQRGTGLGGSHDEREQTLNQILVEMDGFEPHANVIVIAATNRPDVLDPALLRPGRFDRRIIVDLPDINDREAILKVHAKNKPLAKNVALRVIAEHTPGFSGADLENLLNEAAILAARQNKKQVEMQEILESIEKVLLGPERKSYVLNKKEKEITAYHEAGHALVAHMLPHTDPVRKISIISRGQAAGYTLKLPEEEKRLHNKSEFTEELATLLGGWVTEKEVFGEVTTGARSDLKQATKLARKLVMEYGMSDELGPQTFGEKEELIFLGREISEQRNYSEKVAEQIDKEVAKFIGQAQKQAQETITQNKEKLEKIVKALLKKETIDRKEFEKLME